MTVIRNKYIGMTHPLSSDDRLDEEAHNIILQAWKASNCIQGIHLFDEVLSSGDKGPEHYLHCDACGVIVYIERVEIPDGKGNEV